MQDKDETEELAKTSLWLEDAPCAKDAPRATEETWTAHSLPDIMSYLVCACKCGYGYGGQCEPATPTELGHRFISFVRACALLGGEDNLS